MNKTRMLKGMLICVGVLAIILPIYYNGPSLYMQYAPPSPTEREQWVQAKPLFDEYPSAKMVSDFQEFDKTRDSDKLLKWAEVTRNYAGKFKELRKNSLTNDTRVTHYIDYYIKELELASITGDGFAEAYKNGNGFDSDYKNEVVKITFLKVKNQRMANRVAYKESDIDIEKLQRFMDNNFLK